MNCCNFKTLLVFGRGILTAAFDGGCYCALQLKMHCFGFSMCVRTAWGADFILRASDK